jgi:hypothetical protein
MRSLSLSFTGKPSQPLQEAPRRVPMPWQKSVARGLPRVLTDPGWRSGLAVWQALSLRLGPESKGGCSTCSMEYHCGSRY